MDDFKLCLGQNFYRMDAAGSAVASAGTAWNHREALTRHKISPHTTSLYGPINRYREYARLDQRVGFFVSLTVIQLNYYQ